MGNAADANFGTVAYAAADGTARRFDLNDPARLNALAKEISIRKDPITHADQVTALTGDAATAGTEVHLFEQGDLADNPLAYQAASALLSALRTVKGGPINTNDGTNTWDVDDNVTVEGILDGID